MRTFVRWQENQGVFLEHIKDGNGDYIYFELVHIQEDAAGNETFVTLETKYHFHTKQKAGEKFNETFIDTLLASATPEEIVKYCKELYFYNGY